MLLAAVALLGLFFDFFFVDVILLFQGGGFNFGIMSVFRSMVPSLDSLGTVGAAAALDVYLCLKISVTAVLIIALFVNFP